MAFEAILSERAVAPRSWRRVTIAVSLAAHAAALVAGIVHSLWQVDEMPMPSIEVTLADSVPPPPPPPPPARKKSQPKAQTTRKIVEPNPQALVQPKDTPQAPEQEPEPDGNEPEGVVGGVEGGVVGGVVGGVPAPPPPPPPPPKKGPEMVSARIARGQLLINPSDPRYRVDLPPALARTGETFTALLLVCVSAQGSVTGVRVLSSAGPALDPQFPRVLRRWRYRPLLMNGRPTPFCYRLRYQVSGR